MPKEILFILVQQVPTALQDRVETGEWPRPESAETGEDIGASVAADELASLARRRVTMPRQSHLMIPRA